MFDETNYLAGKLSFRRPHSVDQHSGAIIQWWYLQRSLTEILDLSTPVQTDIVHTWLKSVLQLSDHLTRDVLIVVGEGVSSKSCSGHPFDQVSISTITNT